MDGNSVARVYGEWMDLSSGGDGDCEEVDGTDMLECPVEPDPGSGCGASLAVWRTGDNCWEGYRIVRRNRQDRSLASRLRVPANIYIRGPKIQGCIKSYEDVW